MNEEQGLILAKKIIQNNSRHKYYDRTVELAKEYFDIFTGEGVNSYMRRIERREDPEMFEQRKKIYQTVIPSTVKSILSTFNKVARSNRVFSSIDSKGRDEVLEKVKSFYSGHSESGVDAYIQSKWVQLNVYDPNAFICIDFEPFDNTLEKANPYPIVYQSEDVLNYNFKNGVLHWVFVRIPQMIIRNAEDKNPTQDYSYILYLENSAIKFTQYAKTYKNVEGEGVELANRMYAVSYFDTKSKGVPLVRAGYESDPVTKDNTCVSILHYALPFFKKEIKTGSEFDLTMSLHVFPQKIQYGKVCHGDREHGKTCNERGEDVNGSPCTICNGTKVITPIHTSAQDIIYIQPPRNPDDPVLDLEKVLVYKTPPIDLIKFQKEYQETLFEQAKKAVFPSESVVKSSIQKTATEYDLSMDSVYDALYPFGQKYSHVWRFIVSKIAVYTDNDEDLELYHQFPKDLKLKSIASLLTEAKLASESGLSSHAIDAINSDVLEAYYADDQDTLTRIRIKNKFNPFSGKSEKEIQFLLTSGMVTEFYRILYVYFDVIFDDIDSTLGDRFYLMNYAAQKGIIDEKVRQLMPTPVTFEL